MKAKMVIISSLIIGLIILAVLLAIGLVIILGIDIEYGLGFLTPLAFVIAAFIFGYCMNKVINRILKL